ncbi:MAG: glycosyltransferase [Candidatus Saganbacteria bacterium]|nr:glycosyltransferase [Candidatus Saganbacteria bacterium]
MKFSIIVPAYNIEKYISGCLDSLVKLESGNWEKEVLLIDDCSFDNTYQILEQFRDDNKDWVKLFKNEKNLGLGLTRNVGIENATGEWLIFLDGDDRLSADALKSLCEYISRTNNSLEVVGYNWRYDKHSNIKSEKYSGRWDLGSLLKKKDELIAEYVSLGLDPSVVYAAVKKDLLDKNKLRFRAGLHEDVEFQFKVYFWASKIGILDRPLYLKNNREGSIINSISKDHIKSFLGALLEIYLFLSAKNMCGGETLHAYWLGVLRVVASEARYIWQRHGAKDCADELYFELYSEYVKLLALCNIAPLEIENTFKPKYIMIAEHFLNLMANKPKSISKNMGDYLEGIKAKSWGCYDLYNSVFLTPDEIRTCCKRFFSNNEMKGDAVLLGQSGYSWDEFTPQNILKAKRCLHTRLNRGTAQECMGCPYLAFREWAPIAELKIEYISFEYNTVCNMKCNYCSDRYFGGKKPKYDVLLLIDQLFEKGSLASCKTVMWGGGEPTLDKFFDKLIGFMAENFPHIKQRVFTNATVFSDLINGLLKEDKILTITSIDAGNEENFYKTRKHKGFKKVFANLKKYSLSKPENMIIKYIITAENRSLDELQSFASYVKQHSLEKCNFQISVDFKEEFVDIDSLVAAIALHTYLSDINVRFIFFDDLFWQRISCELNMRYDKVLERLKELNLERAFAKKDKYESVVIWGAGIQAQFLIEKSAFFKDVKIKHLVDNSAEKVGKKFFGYNVLAPEVLLESDSPVLIAAVQNIPNILGNYYKLGIHESRLIKEVVV